jgi:hypothetical protein
MSIPIKLILTYLEEKFPENIISGREFRTNSFLVKDDFKKKLYVNLDSGLWSDFKAGESGNFYQLISMAEGIPLSSAQSQIRKKAFDAGYNLFGVKEVPSKKQEEKTLFQSITADVETFEALNPTKDINSPSFLKRLASRFAYDRALEKFKFYISRTGKYSYRIIIPYFDTDKSVFYFQARTLRDNGVKYLNPSQALYGIKTSEILYPYNEDMEYVVVSEGPLDAMSLQTAGLNATCTQGCKMSHTQAQKLKNKKVIIAYDNDEAGRSGFLAAKKQLLHSLNSDIYSVTPPKEFNDWNDFLVARGKEQVFLYVQNHIMKADFELTVIERLT